MNYIIIILFIVALFILSGSDDIIQKISENWILLLFVLIYFVYNNIHFGILLILVIGYITFDEDLYNRLKLYYANIKKYFETSQEEPGNIESSNNTG